MNFDFDKLKGFFLEQIRLAATSLPQEVRKGLELAKAREEKGSVAENVFEQLIQNVLAAEEHSIPICQDTGTHIHYIYYPVGIREKDIEEAVIAATIEATKLTYLRPNTVDPITDKNSGNNIGKKNPQIHFHQWDNDYIHGKLMLKGGGSENVSAQYTIPDSKLHAGRDLEGVRRVVIDAVRNAQGMGCAPGVLGVGIGGDRGSSFMTAKEQLFRNLFDENEDKDLAELEKKLFDQINTLGIGPMGFGGNTTVMGVKLGTAHRLPASYFVSIAYMCWAYRKAEVIIKADSVEYKN
jgi:fumarate hydratase class I